MRFWEMLRRHLPRLTGADECRAVRMRFVDRLAAGSEGGPRGAGADPPSEDADHLARCEACRDACDDLLEAWNGLPEGADVYPPADVGERVLAAAREALARPPGEPEVRQGTVGAGGRGPERGGRDPEGGGPPGAAPRRGGPRAAPAWRRPRWLLPRAGLAAAVVALFATLMIREGGGPPVAVGREAPDFRMTHVASGDDRSLAAYRGEVVLLHVWATWCTPCEREMPTLERLERRLGPEGLRVVAVSIDRESRHKVQRWAEERGIDLTLLQDRTGEIERRYQVVGVPETFLIGPDGVLLWRGAGARDWDDPDQAEVVRDVLRRGGTT